MKVNWRVVRKQGIGRSPYQYIPVRDSKVQELGACQGAVKTQRMLGNREGVFLGHLSALFAGLLLDPYLRVHDSPKLSLLSGLVVDFWEEPLRLCGHSRFGLYLDLNVLAHAIFVRKLQ
jgi:hypothetical protein